MDTDAHWKTHGRTQPYFAVLVSEEFKHPTPESKQRFFETGLVYVEDIMAIIRTHVDGQFAPETALDFGCGVGRILLPLSKICRSVVGIDVSQGMLSECAANLQAADSSAELVPSLNVLEANRKFDFVHTFIVLQHIPRRIGTGLVADLLDRVGEKGVALLHVTFRHRIDNRVLRLTLINQIKNILFCVPPLRWLAERVRRKPVNPPMLMENYDLNVLFSLLFQRGFNNVYTRFTDHSLSGLIIMAQRSSTIRHPLPF